MFFRCFFFLSYNIQFTICSWESETICEDTFLPSTLPFLKKKPRREKQCNVLELKTEWPGRKCFSIVSREAHVFHPGRGSTQNLLSEQMSPCTRPRTCEFLFATQHSSFPNTLGKSQPTANRWKISASFTESQPHPNKLESFQF